MSSFKDTECDTWIWYMGGKMAREHGRSTDMRQEGGKKRKKNPAVCM